MFACHKYNKISNTIPRPARKIRSVSEVDITFYLVRGYLNPQIRLIRVLQSSVQA